MAKTISTVGLNLIKQFEGCRLTAYKAHSSEKYWTIGWGHYGSDVKQGQTITQAEADSMLLSDLRSYVGYVNNTSYCPVTNKLNQNQFDALVSFCYNCGPGNLKSLCSSKKISQISSDLLLYVRAGGEVLSGLVKRRRAEKDLFDSKKKGGDPLELSSTKFSEFLKEAEKHVGEGNSWTYKKYGTSGIPWCAAFVSAVALEVGGLIGKVFVKTVSAKEHASQAVKKGYGKFYKGPSQSGKSKPQAGDLFFLRQGNRSWSTMYDCDHVGIVYEITSDSFKTIEGNSGTWDNNTSYVKKNSYKFTDSRVSGYYRPDWSKVGGTSGYNPADGTAGGYSDLYDVLNTREDATIREVGYINDKYKPSIKSSDIKLSVINYTTMLQAFVKLVSPEGGSKNTDTGKLTGKSKIVVDYLLDKGLNGAAACGVLGNIQHESPGINTAAVGDGGTSFGICQWHYGRGTNMKKYVGSDWASNLSGQLDYLWYDLKHNYSSVLKTLKDVSNTQEGCKKAADTFVRKFEVPANVDNESKKRQETALNYFKQLIIIKKDK